MNAHFGIGDQGSRSQPHVEVQVFGDGHFRGVGAGGIPGEADLYRVEFPDPPIADQFRRHPELGGGALLRPHL